MSMDITSAREWVPYIARGVEWVGAAVAAGFVGTSLVNLLSHADKKWVRNSSNKRSPDPAATGKRPSFLRHCRWLLSKTVREDLDLADADLKRDCRQMRKEGCREGFIRFVIWWKSAGVILTLLFNSLKGWITKALAFKALLHKLRWW